jgi:hypothetical protein
MQRRSRPLNGTQKSSTIVQETRNQPPGTGILIDTEAAINNEESVYFILINGWRIYGKTKEDVVTQLRNLSDEERNMIKTSSKLSSKTAQKTTVGKSPSFLNRIKGASSSAWQGTKGALSSAWQGTKKAATATGQAASYAAGVTGRGLSRAASATGQAASYAAGVTGRGLSRAASATGRGLSMAATATGQGLSTAASAAGRTLAAAKQRLSDAMKKKEQAEATPGTGDNAKAQADVQQAKADLEKAKRDAALKKHINSTKNMTEENVNNQIKGMFGGTRKKKSTTRK